MLMHGEYGLITVLVTVNLRTFKKAGNKVETVEQESVIQSLGASANAPMHQRDL